MSEAVVRRILVHLASNPGHSLCAFSTDEIASITFLVGEVASSIGGTSVANINANVESVAANSAAVNSAIEAAGSS